VRRRVKLVISLEKLARLLNLRAGIEIVAADYDARREVVELFLSGEEFPPKHPRAEIIQAPLLDVVDLD
jgi:hypothetical protein